MKVERQDLFFDALLSQSIGSAMLIRGNFLVFHPWLMISSACSRREEFQWSMEVKAS